MTVLFKTIVILFISQSLIAQTDMSSILYDNSVQALEEAVKKAGRKHALYSYNIANATTPDFEPILYPEDQAELESMAPMDREYFQKVLIEHMSTSLARNRNFHAAYLSLYKKKFEIYRQVATLGKK
ncbi:hypothetical protein DID78_04705 [Candidatus Marinamargulisbacteria bacterium SCGC AG-343-D04]|nr:hypothetical protein DID78_04705 [Candidatus Marinamargulisbacteria bacterium SCGC AG-343-D04]